MCRESSRQLAAAFEKRVDLRIVICHALVRLCNQNRRVANAGADQVTHKMPPNVFSAWPFCEEEILTGCFSSFHPSTLWNRRLDIIQLLLMRSQRQRLRMLLLTTSPPRWPPGEWWQLRLAGCWLLLLAHHTHHVYLMQEYYCAA